MLYMVIERFRDGDARPVHQRFREHGRMAPDGWISRWRDLVDFEVRPVIESAEAAARVAVPR